MVVARLAFLTSQNTLQVNKMEEKRFSGSRLSESLRRVIDRGLLLYYCNYNRRIPQSNSVLRSLRLGRYYCSDTPLTQHFSPFNPAIPFFLNSKVCKSQLRNFINSHSKAFHIFIRLI